MTLEQLRKLCEEATPGPWEVTSCNNVDCWCSVVEAPNSERGWVVGDGSIGTSDAQFIAAARTYMPLLLAVAEAVHTIDDDYWTSEMGDALANLEKE